MQLTNVQKSDVDDFGRLRREVCAEATVTAPASHLQFTYALSGRHSDGLPYPEEPFGTTKTRSGIRLTRIRLKRTSCPLYTSVSEPSASRLLPGLQLVVCCYRSSISGKRRSLRSRTRTAECSQRGVNVDFAHRHLGRAFTGRSGDERRVVTANLILVFSVMDRKGATTTVRCDVRGVAKLSIVIASGPLWVRFACCLCLSSGTARESSAGGCDGTNLNS